MDLAQEPPPSRYVVGIDLGTTNCAAAFVDSAAAASGINKWRVQTLPIPQIVAPFEVEARDTLPSFHYEAAPGEFGPSALDLKWEAPGRTWVVGSFARDHGALVPSRLITSAKSWLCHTLVDRTAELLPWHGAEDVTRLSPLEVSSRYLSHIRAVWDHAFPAHRLSDQDVVITLPASFDEVARELTVKAARLAGLPRVVLVEEPQAAFYAWIDAQGEAWPDRVRPGHKILVCDVGGGTTDLTLIRVRRAAAGANREGGSVQFHRVAVGEHLILGGDNLDLALAHYLERKLMGEGRLESRQWAVLVRTCQKAKEALLGANPPERTVLHLPGAGSRLIGGGLQIEITREEAHRVLVEGFLPRCRLDEAPSSRRSGFQEFGLPFAADAGITRYLAAFLTAHRNVALYGEPDSSAPADMKGHDPARPDLVLFNGGFFASSVLRQRLLEVLTNWFQPAEDGGRWQPAVLENDRLDLAVARGAAYYGMVRRGVGVKITAGLARTYYIGVETEAQTPTAVCLMPAGIEEGEGVELSGRQFELLIRHPVEFPLFVSSTRLTDKPGELIAVEANQMTPLPPIRTVLQAGRRGAQESVPVHLHARLSEIGTLQLWCAEASGSRTWRLEFDVRSATQTDRLAHTGQGEAEGVLDESLLVACQEFVSRVFSAAPPEADAFEPIPPDKLVKRLEDTIELRRRDWPMPLLRGLWDTLIEAEAGRRKSVEHETRWLYLTGFALRPGYGMAVDDWRVAQTWRLLQGRRIHHTLACRIEWLILWRRIAGGLAAGQQRALADPLLSALRPLWDPAMRSKGRRSEVAPTSHETAEMWRLLGSLELLSAATKIELANAIVELLVRDKSRPIREALLWTLGRLAARVPLYGPLNGVVPPEHAERWLERLLDPRLPSRAILDGSAAFTLMQLSRRTLDRYRDISGPSRDRVLAWLTRNAAPEHLQLLVSEGGSLRDEEQGQVFGEGLPSGLRWREPEV